MLIQCVVLPTERDEAQQLETFLLSSFHCPSSTKLDACLWESLCMHLEREAGRSDIQIKLAKWVASNVEMPLFSTSFCFFHLVWVDVVGITSVVSLCIAWLSVYFHFLFLYFLMRKPEKQAHLLTSEMCVVGCHFLLQWTKSPTNAMSIRSCVIVPLNLHSFGSDKV